VPAKPFWGLAEKRLRRSSELLGEDNKNQNPTKADIQKANLVDT
jgi:hypothetical protein